MNRLLVLLLALGAAGAIAVFCVVHKNSAAAEDLTVGAIIKNLSSEDMQVRYDELKKTIVYRHELILATLKLAREADDARVLFGKKKCAVELLGELRADEAVEFLIENIDIRMPEIIRGKPSEYEGFPCAEALFNIGNPAAEMIWEKYFLPATREKLPLYLKVLKGVWGVEICRLLFKEKLKSNLTDAEKANLQAALDNPMFKEEKKDAK